MSIDMDLAQSEVASFDRPSLKSEARRALAKFARCPSCESPLRFASATIFINWQLGKQLGTASALCAAFLYIMQNCQRCNETFGTNS
jgi:hypothetical protein